MNFRNTIALSFLVAVAALRAHDFVPAPEQSEPIALINATIHPVSSDPIQNGSIILENGTITAIGTNIDLPQGIHTIDLSGKHVYPGLISSLSSLGLVEINAVRATRDLAESGTLNPNARAATAINPDSELIPVTRANGVLVAHVLPQTSRDGLMAGTTAVMNLDGWTIEGMALETDLGIAIDWPSAPREPRFDLNATHIHDSEKSEESYQKKIQTLADAFHDARSFWKAKGTHEAATPVDLRWESLKPVLDGVKPVFVYANSVRQIRDAIHWAEQEEIRLVLTGGSDAWRVADQLASNGIPVILDSINALPTRRWEPYDTAATRVSRLLDSGVSVAISYYPGGPTSSNERNLPYEAAKAVAHGLPREEALKAITLYPAQILGIADRVGSLETGKDATLIITNGDPLDIRSQVEMAFIQGRPIDLSSRHTQLYEKYLKKYPQRNVD